MSWMNRKFYSQCCINMFFTVELICYDLDFDLRTMWRYNSFLLSGFMEMFILLFVPGLGKMTLFNSLSFIFCFCSSSVMFFLLINLCILCFLCPVNHISPTPSLHFLFFCWNLIYSVFVRITLTFLGKLFLMILRNWLCSDEIKHKSLWFGGFTAENLWIGAFWRLRFCEIYCVSWNQTLNHTEYHHHHHHHHH